MQVTVPHTLPPEEAKKRLDKFAENLKQQFPNDAGNITQTWQGDTCTVSGRIKGFSIGCSLHVNEEDVTAKGDVPWLARPFQSTIESAIRSGLEKALA